MATTYNPIATTTLGTAAASITFSSISSAYTDLRVMLACSHNATFGANVLYRFNNDSGTNYSLTTLQGSGTAAASSNFINGSSGYTSAFQVSGWANIQTFHTLDVMSYANTSTYKTTLTSFSGDNGASGSDNYVQRNVCLWRSTAAITRVDLLLNTGTFNVGTTATLYGILKA